MTRSEKAIENFNKGYNCSQSVALAFSDVVSIPEDVLLKLTSSLGGGISRLREVCGAVSAMSIVAGCLYGYCTPETGSIKAEHYGRIQSLALQFEEKFGSVVCRELLGLSEKHSSPTPAPRTSTYYAVRPCAAFIGFAAQILEDYIKEH